MVNKINVFLENKNNVIFIHLIERKQNYFKVYGILELRMKYHPPKTKTEFEKEFLCTQ